MAYIVSCLFFSPVSKSNCGVGVGIGKTQSYFVFAAPELRAHDSMHWIGLI